MLKNTFDLKIVLGMVIFIIFVSVGILTAEMQLNKLTLNQPIIEEEAKKYYDLVEENTLDIYLEGNRYMEQIIEKVKPY
ncbi:hypothetical protein [Anaerosinus sp.]|uniref:hypothetical protein n=1 Tax=Selenobaculum sp. TaxID=3074374 RepID=UPI0015A936FE